MTDNAQKQSQLLNELDKLLSEGRNLDTMDIDLLESREILLKMNNEDQKVALVVRQSIDEIAKAVDAVVNSFARGGRLIYIGAGTSGRLGVLDAVECPPTFSVSPDKVVGLIAGGEKAFVKAVEGAEDNRQFAIDDLMNAQLSDKDVVVGIAASGRTPYVVSALEFAKSVGAVAVGISCNPDTAVLAAAEIKICAPVGPEALTGSTRLKSGTAQKLILNMISTASMIRSGKSYHNLMVDVNASNEKLYARAVRIVMQATDCDAETANKALQACEHQVKPAILMILTGSDFAQSKAALKAHNGFIRKAVEDK